MKTTFVIDGGLGRQIAAIPALEKYVKNNPDTTIITHFWTPIFWGNPTLACKVFDSNTKGLFERIKDSRIIKPEPYYNTNYINDKISMADAFNEEINGDEEKMPNPRIYLSDTELKNGKNIAKQNGKKVICFQPFGSTAKFESNDIIDQTVRSLTKEATLQMINVIKNDGFDIAFFDDREIQFLDRNKFLNIRGIDCRVWASVIANCDYFVGVDSAGQHIARAFNKPGTVIMGGTSEINTSYPDHFTIIKKEGQRRYMSYRLCDFDYWLSELENTGFMNYSIEEINKITQNILKDVRVKCK